MVSWDTNSLNCKKKIVKLDLKVKILFSSKDIVKKMKVSHRFLAYVHKIHYGKLIETEIHNEF